MARHGIHCAVCTVTKVKLCLKAKVLWSHHYQRETGAGSVYCRPDLGIGDGSNNGNGACRLLHGEAKMSDVDLKIRSMRNPFINIIGQETKQLWWKYMATQSVSDIGARLSREPKL